jgi:antitoxin component YwqK of YwqJK toxin-antitoxin module
MNLIHLNGKLLLETEFKTGNKAWVAKITGLDPKFTFNRIFLNRTRNGLKLTEVHEGEIIEEVIYSHSGKHPRKYFYQIKDGALSPIEERDVILKFQ